MGDRWSDVSGWQRWEEMRWPQWRALGIKRAQYRLTLGKRIDPMGPLHRVAMRQAGLLTGSYAVIVEYSNIIEQVAVWVDNIPDDDENDDWLDAERVLVTEAMLSIFCSEYDRRSRRQRLVIYTGHPWWISHVPPNSWGRYARYGLVIAGYPYDTPAGQPVPMDPVSVARRSNPPPPAIRPRIPPPWTLESGWQHTGQGTLPGYGGRIDLGIYRVNPGLPAAPSGSIEVTDAIGLIDRARLGLEVLA